MSEKALASHVMGVGVGIGFGFGLSVFGVNGFYTASILAVALMTAAYGIDKKADRERQ